MSRLAGLVFRNDLQSTYFSLEIHTSYIHYVCLLCFRETSFYFRIVENSERGLLACPWLNGASSVTSNSVLLVLLLLQLTIQHLSCMMFSIFPSSFTRSGYRVLAVILVFLILQQYLSFRKPVSVGQKYPNKEDVPSTCNSLEALDDLFVILRTGASEAPKKLPVHFSTTLRCVPHYAIYSDYEEDIEGHHIYNALDEINPDIISTHADFEYYRRLQEKGREAFSSEELEQWGSAKNTNGGRDSPGWRLDKWKFLPLAEKALRHRPDAKWYIFIESDTYMLWQTLLEWLAHFNPSKPHYLGMQMQIGDVVFAYGGGGFAISNPALNMVVAHHRENLKFYDDLTGAHWAGDCILGKALADSGVNLLWSFRL